MNPAEATAQLSAGEEVAQFAHDEARQRAAGVVVVGARQEGLQVLGEDSVQNRGLGLPALPGLGDGVHRLDGWLGPGAECGFVDWPWRARRQVLDRRAWGVPEPTPMMIRFPTRPATAGFTLLLLLTCTTGCALPRTEPSAAAEDAMRDDRPVAGSVVTMVIGGISCPQ